MVNVTAEDHATTMSYTLAAERLPSTESTLCSLESSAWEMEFSPDLTEYDLELADEINELSFTFETSNDAATVEVTLERPNGVTMDAIESKDGRCSIFRAFGG